MLTATAILGVVGLVAVGVGVLAPVAWRGDPWLVTVRIRHVVDGITLVLAAVAAAWALVRGSWWLTPSSAFVIGWVGSGAAFSWGLFRLLSVVTRAPESAGISAAQRLSDLGGFVGGLLLAIELASVVERGYSDVRRVGACAGPDSHDAGTPG